MREPRAVAEGVASARMRKRRARSFRGGPNRRAGYVPDTFGVTGHGAMRHEQYFQSDTALSAAGNRRNIPFRSARLELVDRPDREAPGGTMAGLAGVEADFVDPGRRGGRLGSVRGRLAALGGCREDIGGVCDLARRPRPYAPQGTPGGSYCARRVVARQSHRQFPGTITAIALGWLSERTAS